MNVKEKFTKFMEKQVDKHSDIDVTNWDTKEELEALKEHEQFIYDLAAEGWKYFFKLFKEENKLSDSELEEFEEEIEGDEEFLRDLEDDLQFRYDNSIDDYIEKTFSDANDGEEEEEEE